MRSALVNGLKEDRAASALAGEDMICVETRNRIVGDSKNLDAGVIVPSWMC